MAIDNTLIINCDANNLNINSGSITNTIISGQITITKDTTFVIDGELINITDFIKTYKMLQRILKNTNPEEFI